VRQLLEGEAAARAATHMSPQALAELKALHERMRPAAARGDANTFSALNHAFHAAIFASCGNPILVRQIEQAGAIYPRTRAIFVMFPQRAASAQREHREIIRDLERRDAAGARAAYLDHMAHGYALLLQYHRASAGNAAEAAPPRPPRIASEGK
jgi:DNA-binding GntR family transcriptional regulator